MDAGDATIVVLDDGELDDVVAVCRAVGAPVTVIRGSAAAEIPLARRLLVATARRAQALAQAALRDRGEADWTGACRAGTARDDAGPFERPASLVVTSEDSPAVRGLLREAGFDILVRRPVHPTLLRLLVERSLYRGPERRRAARIPLGDAVTYSTGTQRRNAVVTDLSERGARLVSRYGARRGMHLRLELAGAAADGGVLVLEGRVLRSRSAGEGARADEIAIALEFEPLAPDVREALQGFLRLRAAAAEAGGAAAPHAPRRPGASAPRSDRRPHERRRHERVSFERGTVALGDGDGPVLLGRDLSRGGVRLEAHPSLVVGACVRLAIFGRSDARPVEVDAVVVRNDGDEGVALRFDSAPRAVADALDALVAALPPVEALGGGEVEALGSVVARVVGG